MAMDEQSRAGVTAPLISVTIVCYNGAADIRRCMAALRAQTWPNFEIVAVDNASKDDSKTVFAEFEEVRLFVNTTNTGQSPAQNQAIRESRGDFIVSLNLDTQAEPSFLEQMWIAMQIDDRVGIVCPKILRMERDGSPSQPPQIDSAGAYATPDMRHHNRGSQAEDLGQFERPCYVFGYTGAAAMFRRTMLDDLTFNGMVMDEDYFVYREDSDLSWRAQLAGWRCLYMPYSVIYHQRHVFAGNRDRVSAFINMHSTKNRYLLRINNTTPGVFWKTLIPATVRDLGIVVYVLLKERTSLSALSYIVRERKRLFAKRALIQKKRRADDSYLAQWFEREPIHLPMEPSLEERLVSQSEAAT